jgi:steroid 5-alpha reductase family enzyme
MMLLAVWGWGIRLTINWAYTFKGLLYQDWRYDKYKADFPKSWPLVNFFGINFMPTVIVYLALVPALVLLDESYRGNYVTHIAFLVCICAAVIQYLADSRLHRFRRYTSGEVCNEGLWSYSRHPNYLGEILMWWGVYFMLLSNAPEKWVLGIGALANTLLFVFISIPLMEKRQLENKPGYYEYMKKTNMLIPFFRK